MRKNRLEAMPTDNLRTGGVRMKRLLLDGRLLLRGGQFFDLYNGNIMRGVSGAIRTTIDHNLYYITLLEET